MLQKKSDEIGGNVDLNINKLNTQIEITKKLVSHNSSIVEQLGLILGSIKLIKGEFQGPINQVIGTQGKIQKANEKERADISKKIQDIYRSIVNINKSFNQSDIKADEYRSKSERISNEFKIELEDILNKLSHGFRKQDSHVNLSNQIVKNNSIINKQLNNVNKNIDKNKENITSVAQNISRSLKSMEESIGVANKKEINRLKIELEKKYSTFTGAFVVIIFLLICVILIMIF